MQFLCANIYIHSVVDHILTSPVFASRYLKFNLKLYVTVMQMYHKELQNFRMD